MRPRPPRRAGYDELAADLKAGRIHPLYLLWGEESFLLSHAFQKLIEAVLEAPDDPFNLTRFSSLNHSLSDALAVAGEIPMFKPMRVVVYDGLVTREPHGAAKLNIKRREREALQAYAASPCPSTVLVFTAAVCDYRQRFLVDLQPALRIYEMVSQSPDRLARWIPGKAQRLGLKLTPDAAEELLTQVGPSMTRLASELEKLALYCEPGGRADRTEVRALVEGSTDESVYVLSDAIGRGDARGALRTLRHVLALQADGEIRVISELRRYLTLLLRIRRHLSAGVEVSRIAATLRLPPFVVRKNVDAARFFTEEVLSRGLHKIARIERSAKGGGGEVRSELELLVVGLSRR